MAIYIDGFYMLDLRAHDAFGKVHVVGYLYKPFHPFMYLGHYFLNLRMSLTKIKFSLSQYEGRQTNYKI